MLASDAQSRLHDIGRCHASILEPHVLHPSVVIRLLRDVHGVKSENLVAASSHQDGSLSFLLGTTDRIYSGLLGLPRKE